MGDRDRHVFALYRLTQGPERHTSLIEALRAATPGAGLEPGCRSSRILLDVDDPGGVVLLEEWDTKAALERHMRTPGFRRLLAVLELSSERPEVTYVEAGRARGLDWIEQVVHAR
jgi:quinol monooxygenase YgiN